MAAAAPERELLKRFEVQKFLGKGSYGSVYVARDPRAPNRRADARDGSVVSRDGTTETGSVNARDARRDRPSSSRPIAFSDVDVPDVIARVFRVGIPPDGRTPTPERDGMASGVSGEPPPLTRAKKNARRAQPVHGPRPFPSPRVSLTRAFSPPPFISSSPLAAIACDA